jgi:hypothetical protein
LENAIADVAEMYDKDSETLEGWHRKLQEEDPDRVRLANKVAANHHRMRMPRLTKAQVLNSAKHDGERMRVAQVPKMHIPTKPAGYPEVMSATHSNLIAATVPISSRPGDAVSSGRFW